MKIVLAPDSYKECLSGMQIADIMAEAIKQVYPDAEIIKAPVADGGEGFMDTLVKAKGNKAEYINCQACNANGKTTLTVYGLLPSDKEAILDMGQTCSLEKTPVDLRNPLNTTTYGMGQQIKNALDKGCRSFIIGMGGSATNDMGLGLLQALGFVFTDTNGHILALKGGGKQMAEVAFINADNVPETLGQSRFILACDVDNVLLGQEGVAYTYAAQKGATDTDIKQLEQGAENFCQVLEKFSGKNIRSLKSGGAAGGTPCAFLACCDTEIKSGADIIIDAVDLEQSIKTADLVITGEGKVDFQSCYGKAVAKVAALAKKHNVKTVAIVGRKGQGWEKIKTLGVCEVYEISSPELDFAAAKASAPANLAYTVKQAVQDIFK